MHVRSFLALAASLAVVMVVGGAAPAEAVTSLRDDAMPTWVAALIIGAVVGLPVLIGLGIRYGGGPVDPGSLPSSGGSSSSADALDALARRRQDEKERHDHHEH